MSEIKEGNNEIEKEVFISYLDDSGKIINGYVILVGTPGIFVKFKTNKNIISIPSERVLKIKEEKSEND